MKKPIEFWFSIGSTYTYLAVMRLAAVEKNTGIRFVWRPFSVRALMQEMNNLPFVGKPAKEAYMWRDLERRASRLGIDISLPVQYPLKHFDRANRLAILGREEGWIEDYVRNAYRLWFCEGLPAGDEENARRSLEAAGQSPQRALMQAESETIQKRYEEATDEARSLGLFGAPSFVVDGRELFWGDDRLEDAIEFARMDSGSADRQLDSQ